MQDTHPNDGKRIGFQSRSVGSPHLVVLEELLAALDELHQAANAHAVWLKEWHRRFLYRIEPCGDDIREDAHRLCYLGQWYYGQHSSVVGQHPVFATLGEVHQAMHDSARELCLSAESGEQIPQDIYQQFMDRAIALGEHIRALEYGILMMLAHSDPLTGIRNRLMSHNMLEEERARFERTQQPCCLVLIDLDHFKAINDTYGHEAGDCVLRAAAELLATHTRPYDHVFRYGGEEFLLCMPHTDLKAARCVSERLRERLEQTPVAAGNEKDLHVTASFGIACFSTGVSSEEVLRRADQALYAAKQAGRNQVRVWSGAGA